MSEQELEISIGAYSDRGMKEENEDFYGCLIPKTTQRHYKGIVAAIADGMSGSDAGKEASHCCVTSMIEDYYSTPDSWSTKYAGQKILSATNSWLYSQGHTKYDSSKGMVSTLSAIILKSTTAHIFHIGDSRICRLRNGNLEQLTRDHRIWISDHQSYLNRAMGIEPRLEVDYRAFPLEQGDLFCFSTDGVHDFIDEKTLKNHLQQEHGLDTIAKSIVIDASIHNSDDNITCQLIRIDQIPLNEHDELFRWHANLPFPPPLNSGSIIDGFQIEKEIHASKRTHVYMATDTVSNTRVIVKTPSILYDDDKNYIEHFLHEEWAGKRLDHENVLKVLGTDRKKSYIYYATEYLEGQTLREWIDNNPKPLIRDVRKIVEQIVKGLRAFHRMEMLHQDLKPENIMIENNGNVKIIDFGSVKIAGVAEISLLETDDEENILGTLNYTAPEYHLGQKGSIQSDLYSIGVITYEMINRALPYGRNMPEKPNKLNLSKLQYVPSFQNNAMVPIWIDGALKKATQINPNLRYSSLSEFLHDLNNPNKQFLSTQESIPLIDKNPLMFWKILTVSLGLGNLILLYLLFEK